MKRRILALAFAFSMLASTSAFAASFPVGDGVDIGPPPQKSLTRYYSNTKAYSSSSFSTGVWIGGGTEYFSNGVVGFMDPYQCNINEPWNAISVTYQIYDTDGDVRSSETLFGSFEHDDFSLETDRQYFKAYLSNGSGVPAKADGTMGY